MYYTLALLGCCEQTLTAEIPSIMGITNVGKLEIFIHPLALKLAEEDIDAYTACIVHEMHHLVQIPSLGDIFKVIELYPFKAEYKRLQAAASTQEAKDKWQKAIDAMDDETPNSTAGKLKRMVSNTGMDAADNAIVDTLYPGKIAVINSFLKEVFIPAVSKKDLTEEEKEKIGAITPASLSKTIEKDLPKDSDWFFYVYEYMEWLAKQQNKDQDPDSPPEVIPLPSCGADGHDEHDFGDDSTKEEEAEGRRRISDALEKARAEAEILAHKAGRTAADVAFIGKEEALDSRLESVINQIKVKFCRLHSPSAEEELRFERINRIWPDSDLPGYMTLDKPNPVVALVLDTSGSMWNDKTLNQMIAIGRKYFKRNMLSGFYCCDVELTPIQPDSSFRDVPLRGGGGTVFGPKQLEQIIEDLKPGRKKLDIIYATDEEVYGLDEAKKDERVRLHVINIPRLLSR
jgi:hypothetical protein